MEKTVVSLCPQCSACPEVVIEGDMIRIGEDENIVTLKKPEWIRVRAGSPTTA